MLLILILAAAGTLIPAMGLTLADRQPAQRDLNSRALTLPDPAL